MRWRIANGISGFFEPQTRAFLGAHVQLGADNAGYYSTAPLRATLEELVNFDLLGKAKVRLTVGAANLRTSVMHYFDCRDMTLTVDHIMASGALPPAFPAVSIGGDLCWDGGILSNTPAERIFEDRPRRNSLIFAVHLWNPTGPEPTTIWETLHRQKDIQYSSRIANHMPRPSAFCSRCCGSTSSGCIRFPTSTTLPPCSVGGAGSMRSSPLAHSAQRCCCSSGSIRAPTVRSDPRASS
jgi:NTE family protein